MDTTETLEAVEQVRRSVGATANDAVHPFRVNFSDAELAELRRRISSTRWPDRETVTDQSQGPQLATLQKLARYWVTEYDWRKVEARLNALPNFVTEIDGLNIHFIHVRSSHKNALPLIVTHGWPGSIIEQLKIIDPLTNPTAHGGERSGCFPSRDPVDARLRVLCQADDDWLGAGPHRARLGRAHEAPRIHEVRGQGGDWGAIITDLMGAQGHPELLGIHSNMPGIFPPDIDKAALTGGPSPSGLSADEKVAYEQLVFEYAKGIGYGYQMGLRPQALYGIADSPVGIAGYFLDHDAQSLALISRAFDGRSEGLSRDDVLDNVTLTWLTNSFTSGARLYWEAFESKVSFFGVKGVSVPVAVSVFPDELYQAPRSWAERAYPKLIYYNKLEKGGHFAAWEQPKLFTEELRASFRSLRKSA